MILACSDGKRSGDNEVITRKICHEVGLDSGVILLGTEIEEMTDQKVGARFLSNLQFFSGRRLEEYREKVQSVQANSGLYSVRS